MARAFGARTYVQRDTVHFNPIGELFDRDINKNAVMNIINIKLSIMMITQSQNMSSEMKARIDFMPFT